MVNSGYKSIQLVTTSEKSWKDAVLEGYAYAKKSLKGIRNIQIIETDVKVKEDIDKLIYRARIRVNFQIKKD